MDNYCTTCGRCQSCGAKRGTSPTIFTPSQNAAAAVQPVIIESFGGGGAGTPLMGCEHFEIRG